MRRDANEFEFGYALTCHKSQGSQWNSLVIVDESDAFRQHAKRWLYTAITRAAEKVIIKI
jgi:exodeoxyribonuclease-5